MAVKVSIIIVSFCRSNLLKWGLWSIIRQNIPFDLEVIVVNDGLKDETEALCNSFKRQLNIKYLFTGQRNLKLRGKTRWRVPGFAINIGVKQSTGDILILCCAEMFHLNDTIRYLTNAVTENPKHLGIPSLAKDDRDHTFLDEINARNGSYEASRLHRYPDLRRFLPFLIAMKRNEFISIGGYDEDFQGIGFEDNDLMDRLILNGCQYVDTEAMTIHLYHPRNNSVNSPGWNTNKELWTSRRGIIVRNEGREWGKL
jgi:glycosyltransferase involved in cell wall biosynthesis